MNNNTIKLIKEVNPSGQIFYSVEVNDTYVSQSVIYGGTIASPDSEKDELFALAQKKYQEVFDAYNEEPIAQRITIKQENF